MRTSLFKKALRIGLFLFVLLASTAEAAFLHFGSSDNRFYLNENFTVSVFVNAATPVNAVQGVMIFPTRYLEVVQINRSNINSIIDLWVQKPSFSNAGDLGNIRFEGVALNPGFIGSTGKIIDIIFRAREKGTATLRFQEFAVLANDGLGTNVATPAEHMTLTLLPARVREEPERGEDLRAVEEKIKSVEERIESIVQPPAPIPLTGILRAWELLPDWVKVSTLILVGVAALVLSFIILGFGIVVLVWLWSYGWRRRDRVSEWFAKVPRATRRFTRRISKDAGLLEKEVGKDIAYSVHELKREVREAEGDIPFSKLLSDYWISFRKVVRRFFTWQNKEHPSLFEKREEKK